MTLMVVWGVANFILSAISTNVPSTSTFGKVLHSIVAIGPLDMLKVVKTIGAQAVPPGATGLGLVVFCYVILRTTCSCAAMPTARTETCAVRYQACVASSANMTAYLACRSQVDLSCLGDGGAEGGAW
jgi:hypothetical protein